MDQVREVLRVKHYAIRTEQAYCDWIRRYINKGHKKRDWRIVLHAVSYDAQRTG